MLMDRQRQTHVVLARSVSRSINSLLRAIYALEVFRRLEADRSEPDSSMERIEEHSLSLGKHKADQHIWRKKSELVAILTSMQNTLGSF